MRIIDTVKSWFNKEESRMLGQDVARDASNASRGSADAKPHMDERIAEQEEE